MKYVLMLLLLVGCSSPQPPSKEYLSYSWCLINVPAQDQEIIQAAMDQWNSVTNETSWYIGECQGRIERVQSVKDLGESALAGGHVGNIRYADSIQPEILMNVMLHELGHAAKLDHSSNKEDIMYPSITGSTQLSQGDLEAFQATLKW